MYTVADTGFSSGGGQIGREAPEISFYIPIIQKKRDKKGFLREILFSKGVRDPSDLFFILSAARDEKKSNGSRTPEENRISQ